jgi:DNA polymerase elongation subunit (family B)
MLTEALLSGADREPGLVAVEHEPQAGQDRVTLYRRHPAGVDRRQEPFEAFLLVADESLVAGEVFKEAAVVPLAGEAPLRWRVTFKTWKACQKAKAWLAKTTGVTAGNPQAPYFLLNDPVQQHLVLSGRTLFKRMTFGDLRRLQVDIECYTTEGYEFCNAAREGDRLIAIALRDSTGWGEVLSGADLDERAMLERFVALVRERDPDVVEGHNLFNFDLPYLAERARRQGVKLALGRDGSAPAVRPSRFTAGERTIAYTRFNVFGRHVVDTMFLAHTYDVTYRSLEGFGLKAVARHFGLSPADRVYIEGGAIAAEFRRDPARLMRYAAHDVEETEALARLLSQSAFVQTQLLPFAYQDVCVRGNATKIDALLIREYLRQGQALPQADRGRPFAGGYTDLFISGVVRHVSHCDVRSLYPSLMLARGIGPRTDRLGVFLRLLERLRAFRLEARRQAKAAPAGAERTHYEALQATFKVLINAFYGYLGFDQGRFGDFDAAERIAAEGRELLKQMLDWLRAHGARPVESDTDGIYFVPPGDPAAGPGEAFKAAFAAVLPPGIEVEFDGDYPAMFSYKMKNYALLESNGEIVIKGAALKSRGLEPYLRRFLREMVRLKLEDRDAELPALRDSFAREIQERRWPVTMLAKTETLQDAPATYAAKVGQKGRGRNAAYELALASGREYRAGDPVSYYVTGAKKSVPVHAAARLVAAWNAVERDENVPYYLAKLDALYEKFRGGQLGGEGEDA